jgi:hypothetical protein
MKTIIIFVAAVLPFSSHANVLGACTEEYKPVLCTSTLTSKDRRKFSNLCFAEEAGFVSDNCKPMQVQETSTSNVLTDGSCTQEYRPVLCTSTSTSKDLREFSNLCFAKESGFISNNCKPMQEKTSKSDGACTKEYIMPVLCTSTSTSKDLHKFSNLCFAEAAGFISDNCKLMQETSEADGACTQEYMPVLCTSTSTSKDLREFSNLCFAEAAGFISDNCKLMQETSEADGACTQEYMPVLCTSTSTSKDLREFSNLCHAKESGFIKENCKPMQEISEADGACTTIYKPVVCTAFKDSYDSSMFPNLCEAKKAGFKIINCRRNQDIEDELTGELDNTECSSNSKPVVCSSTPNSDDYNKFSNLCIAEKNGFDSNNCSLKTGGLRG